MLGKVEHLIMCKRKAPSFCATHINKRFDRLIIRMTEAQADLPVVRSFNPQAPARPLLTSNALSSTGLDGANIFCSGDGEGRHYHGRSPIARAPRGTSL
mmetsp:Transcript_28738/g.67585  ORF Transcript_28738/g.67585 Transcript_28738/m.67585 type:complete len:99 (+) Transcript_28738:649-945(+)